MYPQITKRIYDLCTRFLSNGRTNGRRRSNSLYKKRQVIRRETLVQRGELFIEFYKTSIKKIFISGNN